MRQPTQHSMARCEPRVKCGAPGSRGVSGRMGDTQPPIADAPQRDNATAPGLIPVLLGATGATSVDLHAAVWARSDCKQGQSCEGE
jgi:hypothetical protein